MSSKFSEIHCDFRRPRQTSTYARATRRLRTHQADIDMVVEEATGKPVKPANLAAGIVLRRQRIAQLEVEKTKLLGRMDEDSDESLKDYLVSINKDLAAAHERLAHYVSQLSKQS